jgi:hypothetical protein
MFADTDAIRALGFANSKHADDLAGISATLSSLPAAAALSLGTVGADFLAALTAAAEDESRAVAAISSGLWNFDATAYRVASAYDSADNAAAARVAGIES